MTNDDPDNTKTTPTPNAGTMGKQQELRGERAVGTGADATAPVTTGDENQIAHTGQIRAGSGQVAVGQHISQVQHITLPTPTPQLHQLRAPVTNFVGRQAEIDQFTRVLTMGNGAAAICGVRGMGGIGKTELALVVANQLAPHFPDAQIVVELFGAFNPLTPEAALQAVIRSFEPQSRLPDDLPTLKQLYAGCLNGKRILMLADDARDEAQVRPLLPPAGCALLVTSRSHIELEGMHTHTLGTLAPAESEALLRTICPRIGDDAPELARLCGYLPLALRVSATFLKRRPTRPVTAYLQSMRAEHTRLAHLHDPKDPALNVEASLALSYDALPVEAQQAFAQLGVFVGSFTLAAAEAVVDVDGSTAADLLDELYLNSLLEYDEASVRYDLHDLSRVFALVRLDDERSVRLRHARYYAAVSYHADKNLYQRGKFLEGMALFDRERQQIDAGWLWVREQPHSAETDHLLLDFANATVYVGDLRYDLRRERIPQLEAQAAAARCLGHKKAEGSALGNLGIAYHALGDYHQAIDFHKQGLVIAREIGDQRGAGNALGNLGVAYHSLGHYQWAIACHVQHLATAHELGDWRGAGNALGNLGNAYCNLGDSHKAMEYHEQALDISREIGDRRGEGAGLNSLGNAYFSLGEYQRAIAYHKQHLVIAREIGDWRGEGSALGNLGSAYGILGNYQQAMLYYKPCIQIFRENGNMAGVARNSWNLGLLYEKQSDLARAMPLMQVWMDFLQQIGHPDVEQDAARLAAVKQKLAEQGD